MFQHLGIVINSRKQGAQELLESIQRWCAEREITVSVSIDQSLPDLIHESDLIVCLGGDGTMLSIAGKMKGDPTPILGVNFGRVGFLTEMLKDEVLTELEKCLNNDFETEDRMLLAAKVHDPGVGERRINALNDIVVSREGLTRMLCVEVSISGERFTKFYGDGLIIASPTGSTAYSLSAGGAIVHPKLDALIITPICPHASSLRPMVVSSHETISIRIAPKSDGEEALLTADGQETHVIHGGCTIEITKSDLRVPIIKSKKRTYLGRLRENFNFPFKD